MPAVPEWHVTTAAKKPEDKKKGTGPHPALAALSLVARRGAYYENVFSGSSAQRLRCLPLLCPRNR